MKTAICCIAKNEDDYLAEWVDYNARLGFDEIHVLQHGDWRYCGPAHPALRLGVFPQDMHQRDALNGWLDDHRHDFDWAAFFDVDEYLVLKSGDCNVKDFLVRYDEHGGVAVNWKRFGDAGLEDDGDRRIVARFTRCEAGLSHEVKTIAHLAALPEDARLADCHTVLPLELTVNCAGRPMTEWMMNCLDLDECAGIACLNHYFTKTLGEWRRKVDTACGYFFPAQDYDWRMGLFEYYHDGRYNEAEDLDAATFQATGHFLPRV